MSSALRTLRALLPPVLGATALSIVGLIPARALIDLEILRASNNEVGNYLQTLGTVYAVLLAFVVFVVWNQFNETRALVEREANELLDLFRIARGLGSVRAHLEGCLRAYTRAVLDREWAAMVASDEQTIDEVGRILDDAWAELHCHEPVAEHEKQLFGEALQRFNGLSDCRTARLTAARTRIPLAMRLLLYSGAVVLVASMYLLAVDSFAIHAIITGALAGAIAHVLYLIQDLDDTFDGDWQVPRAPFERARRVMDAWAQRPACDTDAAPLST